jgi:hypothetical protein
MKVIAINTIHHNGNVYYPGDEISVDKGIAEYLEKEGAIAPSNSAKEETVIDAQELYETTEDFSKLKVKELRAVCALLELPTDGDKAYLVKSIEDSIEE